jgi:hypothetical protein
MSADLHDTQAGFVPDLRIGDPLARHWVRAAMLRLRREVCWRWHLAQAQGPDTALSSALDFARHAGTKAAFFRQDATAAYLTAQLDARAPAGASGDAPSARGSFGWLAGESGLDDAGRFVLGLGLLAALDHGAGPVIAECNARRGTSPTLALAQLLWDRPADIVGLADAGHALWRRGVLQAADTLAAGAVEWESALSVTPVIARMIAFPDTGLPALFEPIALPGPGAASTEAAAGAARLRASAVRRSLRVVPLAGAPGADVDGTAAMLGLLAGCAASRLHINAALRTNPGQLRALLAGAWLRGASVLLADDAQPQHGADAAAPHAYLNELRDLPVTIFIATDESGALPGLAADLTLPALGIPRLTYQERVALWRAELLDEPGVPGPAIEECARRFRFEPMTIRAAAAWMREAPMHDSRTLVEACRVTAPLEVGGLAERVLPRFCADDLVLAPPLKRQFDEIARAMESLGEVHYRWGTGRAWNESGLSILLCGPPGCGKNTFAEALADRLDLPMYRIDLSQVTNKYVGETEKNLKRLFDAADVADSILFFDEADAIFGKRIDVRDAHDRYANLEVSYLLARMERFKGLAVLATNRRKDLDEAFLRRLRAVVELPLPESAQRTQIWRRAVPNGVDGSALDFDFLGRNFNLSGGHIRSAMLNACLQSAAGQRDAACPHLPMEAVIGALKRELDKLKRSPSPAQFGAFADIAKELDRG